ncbi:MAG: hypothetical protein U0W40_07330 [Acidimicrobiia bacterium]
MTAVTLRTVEHRLGDLWAPVRASLGRDRAPVVPWVALGLGGAVVATAIVTGAYTQEVPRRLGEWAGTGWPTLLAGRWWTLGTSFVMTRDWFMATTMPVCLFLGLAPYERRAGHTRAFLVAFVGHVTGTVILALAFAPLVLTHVGMLVRAADNVDYGGSMAIAAGLGALVGFVGDRRITRIAVAAAIGGLLVHHQMADWGHVVALPLGYAVARLRSSREVALLTLALVGLTVLAVGVVAGFGS